jgi:hypothetical protein
MNVSFTPGRERTCNIIGDATRAMNTSHFATAFGLILGSQLALAAHAAPAGANAKAAAGLAFFEAKIRPVLVEKCYSCHSANADELKAGLRLDSRDGILQGGDSGAAAVPGNPPDSLLIQALHYDTYEMPPTGKLPVNIIADFEHWIEIGMPDPRDHAGPMTKAGINIEEGRKFWSFQPLANVEPPAVKDVAWPRSGSDRFILAKLEASDLAPAADADRATWLRRVTFDLIGLPPSLEEMEEFAADDSPDAEERVVDRLLESPHFGERWGRHWLDVARFAESSGGGRSLMFKDAWRYRDYVIQSVNDDKRFDAFIKEQIAGDLLPATTDAEKSEHLIATAYLMLGAHNYEEQDKRALEMDVADEQIDTVGRGLLGMTVSCARCHDHKFDPIPTADYYALAGIFRDTKMLIHENVSMWTTRDLPVDDAQAEALRKYDVAFAKLKDQIAAVKKRAGGKKSKDVTALEKKLASLQKKAPDRPTAMAVEDADKIEDCQICIRGSIQHRGPAVPRGVLQVATVGSPPKFPQDASGRLELAEWIINPQNPLAARVYVNRVWYYLFGEGIVRTLDNFGTTGETPSNPELLDYLAARFMNEGWSTKRLVRELVLSRAYRMSTAGNAKAVAADPENRLLWRMNRKRLDAESLRDSMLMINGRLDLTIGGPNISGQVPDAKAAVKSVSEYGYVFNDVRRSVYTPAFRNRMHELFEVFDFANQNSSVMKRNVTTVAPQALLMLNGTFVMSQARAAAEQTLSSDNASDDELIEQAFLQTLGRPPTDDERKIAQAAVAPEADRPDGRDTDEARLAKWERLYQGLFGCIDFRYLN